MLKFLKFLPYNLTSFQQDFAMRMMSSNYTLRIRQDGVVELFRPFANIELTYQLRPGGEVFARDEVPVRSVSGFYYTIEDRR